MKKMLLIINPVTAKSIITPHLVDIIDIFENGGYDVTVHITKRKNDTCDTVKAIGSQFDTVVSVGGDGTLNETVAGVISLDNKPKIGYIPAGTTNDFATSWGIPSKPVEAARLIIEKDPVPTDVCVFCGRPYIYVAAFGAFTEVSYQTPQQLKQNFGRTAYIVEGIKRLAAIRPWKMKFEYDGKTVEGEFLYGMISNTKRVGGFDLKIKDDISISDGLMELILIKKPEKSTDNAKMLGAVLAQDTSSGFISFDHTKKIRFHTDEMMPWTVDGEDAGSTQDGTIEILHHAVELYL